MNNEVLSILTNHQERMTRVKNAFPLRPYAEEKEMKYSHMLLTGARGIGKTTMLLSKAREKGNILYISADSIQSRGYKLMEVVDDAFMSGAEGVIIDEVHYEENWGVKIKSLIDLYSDKIIWVSDSSSLVLRSGMNDIARRCISLKMPFMSFREFLKMETGLSYEIVQDPFSYSPHFDINSTFLRLFEMYKSKGFRPVYKEGDYSLIAENIVDKIISSDIPYFIPEISSRHMRLMKSVLSYLANSNVPRIETSNLTKSWGVSYEKIVQLLDVMDGTELISIVPTFGDKKEKLSRAKVFFSDPSLYRIFSGKDGNLREALTVLSFRNAGWDIYASDDEEKGDFVVISPDNKRYMIEIGGRGKKAKKSDAVVRDNIDYGSNSVIPLWTLAMMW